jgi:hypothetical protein
MLAVVAAAILLVFSCSTMPSNAMLDENKDRIRTLAVLPLVLGSGGAGASTYNDVKEALGFQEYWNEHFYARFRESISLIDGISVLYPGDDFELTPEESRLGDYQAICEKLGVDAVLGVNLVSYNEVEPTTKAAEFASALLLSMVTGYASYENSVANYQLHTYYLGLEDWNPRVYSQARGLPSIEDQRATFVNQLIAWIDARHPLSARYAK